MKWVGGGLLALSIIMSVAFGLSPRNRTSDGIHIPTIQPVSDTAPLQALLTQYTPKEPHIEEIFNTASTGNTYDYGNCTYYISSLISVPQTLGNADTWATNAVAMGYQTGKPVKGAVAVSTAGYYGHVALVEMVDGTNVTISEMNVFGLGVVDERVVPASDYVYIYFGTF